MRSICGGCGAALSSAGRCVVCSTPKPSKPLQSPGGDLLVVGVRCTFSCRACGFDSPLDELHAERDTATCLKCGLHQTLRAGSWDAALPELHAIADLSGPEPEGASHDPVWAIDSPHAELGTTLSVTHVDGGSLDILAGPGHPLCESCKQPLLMNPEGNGKLKAVCSGCGTASSYACPSFEGGPIGVVGLEHRNDRREAARDGQTFTCAECAAPLPVEGLGRLVRCDYCQTVSRIPVAALQGLKQPPPPDLWWLVFEGPSATRHRLLKGGSGEIEAPPKSENQWFRTGVRFATTTAALAVGGVFGFLIWLAF